MSLRNQLEDVRDRTLNGLNEAHDYFTFTKRAWNTLYKGAQRRQVSFSWRNRSTKTKVNDKNLAANPRRYISSDLLNLSLQQFASIFENFLFDTLRLWLLAYPQFLAKRQLTGKELIGLPDKEAIVDALVEKELRDVFYDRPANWFHYLNERVAIGAPTAEEAERFAEIKATRDVLIHGQGIANAYYVDKAASLARARIGQPLDVPEPYHQASWELICKLVRDIGTGMAGKA